MFITCILFAAFGASSSDKPDFDLMLTKAAARRLDDGSVLVVCDAVLDNRTTKVVNVRSTFGSAFDGLSLVVRDEKGKLLQRQAYIAHQSPFAPPGRVFPLKVGENAKQLGFPFALPADVKTIRVSLVGTLPGSGYDEIVVSDVVNVTIEQK